MPFTVVESPDVKRGLAVREVSEDEQELVRRWRGSVFATEAEAEAFAASELVRTGRRGLGERSRTNALRGCASTFATSAVRDR